MAAPFRPPGMPREARVFIGGCLIVVFVVYVLPFLSLAVSQSGTVAASSATLRMLGVDP